MRTVSSSSTQRRRGYALVTVLILSAISLMALSGALKWTSSSARLTDRNNRFFAATSAAEAATENVLAHISRDYLKSGEATVFNNLDAYRRMYPNTDESALWGKYVFTDGSGNDNQTYVTRTSASMFTPLDTQYEGLYGLASGYRIISNARALDVRPQMIAAVRQDIQVAAIPLFQFAIFYQMDLEINPGPAMAVTGRVHSINNIFAEPQTQLSFLDHVTAVGKINIGKSSLDPTVRKPGPVVFKREHDGGVRSLNLPIGADNSPEAVRQIVEMPPAGEEVDSAIGRERFYNKADLIILVSNKTVTVKSGAFDNFRTTIPVAQVDAFINTDVRFTNMREGKTVNATEIDVGKLAQWSATNQIFKTQLRPSLGREVNLIYVADTQKYSSKEEPGVRLINGQTLPARGLTVATPNPAYVQGNYNAPSKDLGTTNTLSTRPAAIIADSVTLLSPAWSDSRSASPMSSRAASGMTVNAAILAGIVPSNGAHYSGGVENLPRFLEDWSNDTLTYNGSMVVMFPSRYAIAPWGGPDVYSPPMRNWAFDRNFLDATKLPPGTPMILTTIRTQWATIAPNTVE